MEGRDKKRMDGWREGGQSFLKLVGELGFPTKLH